MTGNDTIELPPLWGHVEDRTPEAWQSTRRPQIKALFEKTIFGITPQGGYLESNSVTTDTLVFDGRGRRREVTLTLAGPSGRRTATMLLYTPTGPVPDDGWPVFLGLNILGNHSTTTDPDIEISPGWIQFFTTDRGDHVRRWPYSTILERGYAVATIHAAEFEADMPRAGYEGVRGMFSTQEELLRPEHGEPSSWGTIGAWAFGLSRALDAVHDIVDLDERSVFVHGHSRLGKAALWAALQDSRFAGVVSNDSGCAGASLFRHSAGENVRKISERYSYWFCPAFGEYIDAEAELPVDQHLLLAGILPTPVHVASAAEDHHADPRGEFLSTAYSSPIAELFGSAGTVQASGNIVGEDLPRDDSRYPSPIAPHVVGGGILSYHVREGGHDVLAEDWGHYLDFADRARLSAAQRVRRT